MKRAFAAYSVLAVVLAIVCAATIWFARDYQIPVFVDPEARDVVASVEGDKVVSASLGVPAADNYATLTISGLGNGPGVCIVRVSAFFGNDEEASYSRMFDCEILPSGLLAVRGSLAGSTSVLVCTVIFLAALAIGLGIRFVKRKRNGLLCSYPTVASFAYCIFAGATAFVLSAFQVLFMLSRNSVGLAIFVKTMSELALFFALLALPLVIASSLFLAVSNLSLIRHEGKRPTNALGIAVAVLSAGCYLALLGSIYAYVDTDPAILTVRVAFSYLVNLLGVVSIATIVCGLLAARNKPALDKDFIIILGCGIRKDGTPTPILEGRIRRAMEFADKQYQETGKRAKFVCSGGQGADEVISEAACMANYLRQNGIDDKLILLEDQSTSTFENMKFSRAIIDAAWGVHDDDARPKVAYSTTNYHVFRSGTFALDAGLDAEGMGAKTKWYFWPNAFLREFASFIVCSRRSLIQAVVGILLFAVAMGALQTLL